MSLLLIPNLIAILKNVHGMINDEVERNFHFINYAKDSIGNDITKS